MKKSPSSGKGGTQVISFRIASDLFAILEEHAASLRDETGVPLTASGLARRLVIAGIPTLKKPTK